MAALMLVAGLICSSPVRAGAAPAQGSFSPDASTTIPAGLPVATFTSPVPPDCTYLQAPPQVFCTPTAFGQALAISGNGSEVAAGDPNYGAVAIYTEENGSWPTEPTALFRGPGEFGSAVALSSDGQTLAVGDRTGSVLIYSQQGGAWPATPTASLASPGATPVTSLALSADGGTLLASGAPAAVYVMASGSWPSSPSATFAPGGSAVALSADGGTALIGAPSSGGYGTACLYTQAAGLWPTAPNETFSSPYKPAYEPSTAFGYSVALSADATTALIGEPGFQLVPGDVGAAFVYSSVDGSWTSGPVATFEGHQDEELGQDVSLSGDGTTALVSGPNAGTAYLYTAAAGAWAASPLEAFGPAADATLSADGLSAVTADSQSGSAALYAAGGAPADQSGATPLALVSGYTYYGTDNPSFYSKAAPGSPVLAGLVMCSTVDGGAPVGPTLGSGSHTLDGDSCSGLYVSGAPGASGAVTYQGVPGGFFVQGRDQPINFASAAPTFGKTGKTAVGEAWVLRATASSGMPVTFYVQASSVPRTCTLTSGVVDFTGPGTCVVVAQAAASGAYNPGGYVDPVIVHSVAQLGLHVQAPARGRLGTLLDYSVQLTNSGPGTAAGALVNLVLPRDTSLVSARPKPFEIQSIPAASDTRAGATPLTEVTWYVASLDNGSTSLYHLAALVLRDASATLTAKGTVAMVPAGSIDPHPAMATGQAVTAVAR
jgi:WD40 repeat protein